MRKFNTEGIVIKNINYADSHKIFTIITPDHGIISAMARGVRKISSKRGGNLDTFNKVFVGIVEDTKGYKSITEVRSIKSYKNIKNDLKLITHSFYILDIISSILERDHENRRVYELLSRYLDATDNFPFSIEVLVSYVEVQLAKLQGFGLSTSKCSMCDSRDYELSGVIYFDLMRGGIICGNCGPSGRRINAELLELLSLISVGGPFANLKRFSSETINATTSMIRDYIEYNLWDSLRFSKSLELLFDTPKL